MQLPSIGIGSHQKRRNSKTNHPSGVKAPDTMIDFSKVMNREALHEDSHRKKQHHHHHSSSRTKARNPELKPKFDFKMNSTF
mmetsp:Transcript_41925/g.64180  ORF Transcript_41925/g.64180 Transcript_41925/m.64180 type:complete len:82 (+) Transcript_41925:3338-3583(+)